MKKINEVLMDSGPEDIFIFYSFLLCNRKNQILVTNLKELRKVFLLELKNIKIKYKHLKKDIKRDVKRDVIKSYIYIKKQYFINEGENYVCIT